MKILKCSICGSDRGENEFIFTRFRKPACRDCFHREKNKGSVILRVSQREGNRHRIFSPYFNFWESNRASYPDPVKGIINFPAIVNLSSISSENMDLAQVRKAGEWKWVLKESYKAVSRGSIFTGEELSQRALFSRLEELLQKLSSPFEIFIIIKNARAFQRIIYEIATEKDFFDPALQWARENEKFIEKELSCLLKG